MNNEELLKEWFKDMRMAKKAESTINNYTGTMNQFFKFTNNKNLLEVTRDDIKEFLFSKMDCAPKTLERLYATISSFFYWAENEGLVEEHPMPTWRNKPKSKKENEDIEFLDEKEKIIVHKYFQSKNNPRDMMLYNFMLGTGVRRAEVIGVTVEDIDWETPGVGVVGKGNKRRYIPIKDDLAKALKQYLEESEIKSGYVFRNRSGDKLSPSYINWTFREAKEATRIEKLHPHITRHTYATDCVKNGMDVTDLKEILGHSSLETTMIYPRILRESITKGVKLFAPEVFV